MLPVILPIWRHENRLKANVDNRILKEEDNGDTANKASTVTNRKITLLLSVSVLGSLEILLRFSEISWTRMITLRALEMTYRVGSLQLRAMLVQLTSDHVFQNRPKSLNFG